MNTTQEKALIATNNKGSQKNNKLNPEYRTPAISSPLSTNEIIHNFRQAILDHLGYAPQVIKPTGLLERFSTQGKRDLAGWYVLHLHHDGAAGAFGCWRSGIKQTWHSTSGTRTLSAQEWQDIRQAITREKARATQERRIQAANAQQEAIKLWLAASPASHAHPYLWKKQVGAYGIRQYNDLLLIPLHDLDGTLQSVQTIHPDGTKRFLSGTAKQGFFCLLGEKLTHPQGVFLCEGYATGASLYEAYQRPVLVAFDAGNLLPVATAYKTRHPSAILTVCADNDRKNPTNPGLTKARAVCDALPDVGLVVPTFPDHAPVELSDFNDLCIYLARSSHKEYNHA